jgi:hypothetical protein
LIFNKKAYHTPACPAFISELTLYEFRVVD